MTKPEPNATPIRQAWLDLQDLHNGRALPKFCCAWSVFELVVKKLLAEPVQGEGLTLDVLPMEQRGEYQGVRAELTAGNPLPLASRLECLYDELHSLGWHSYAGWVREAITALEARVEGGLKP